MLWDEDYHTEQVGLIDLGSNSARMVVMAIEPNDAYRLVYQDKQLVRLSEGMQAAGRLTEEAMARTLAAMQNFSHTAELLGVEKMLAVATAAMRSADNGILFRDEIESKTDIPLTIINGREEARLGYLGVINTLPYEDFVLFDLGGASTEVSLVRNRLLKETMSLPLGSLTLTEKFGTQDEVSSKALKAMGSYIKKILRSLPGIENTKLPLIGIGGTVRNLAKIHQRLVSYPIPKLHHYTMAPDAIYDMTEMLASRNFKERAQISGLGRDRADIITAGAFLIQTLLQFTGAEQLIISGNGLREGLFYNYYAMTRRQGQHFPESLLRQSVENFRNTLPLGNEEPMQYITKMALKLYDGLQPLHGFPARYREWLETTCRLHDVGMMINYYSHAQHSAYIIANSPLYGLTHREQATCALIAAFQDGISNKLRRFAQFAKLLTAEDLTVVKQLSTLLAIVKAFDATYDESVTSLAVSQPDETHAVLHLTARSATDIPLVNANIEPHIKECNEEYPFTLSVEWDNADKAPETYDTLA